MRNGRNSRPAETGDLYRWHDPNTADAGVMHGCYDAGPQISV